MCTFLFIFVCKWFYSRKWHGFGTVLASYYKPYISHISVTYMPYICHISIKIYGIYIKIKWMWNDKQYRGNTVPIRCQFHAPGHRRTITGDWTEENKPEDWNCRINKPPVDIKRVDCWYNLPGYETFYELKLFSPSPPPCEFLPFPHNFISFQA